MKLTFPICSIVCALAFPSAAEPEAKEKAADAAPLVFLSKAEVSRLIADRSTAGKTCVFGSRDGKSYGMDSDSEVSLQLEGRAIIGEHGYTYQGYRGSYELEGDGTIVVTLKGYRGKWPEMKLAKTGDVLRLFAKDGDNGFVVGGRGGSVETDDMKPFWPFRLVETSSIPEVTPIPSGGGVKSFTSPTLPENFEWQGDRFEFGVRFTTLKDGRVLVKNHLSDENDWRLPAVKAAIGAMQSWLFYPHREDGEPTEMGHGWNIKVSREDDQVRWVVTDEMLNTVFDSMPTKNR
ncbi:MAG: hypothetical protein V4584_12560 [Verrucomicrobiota bacterium]